MLLSLRRKLGARFPQLVIFKTFLIGYLHSLSRQRITYSQSGEDLLVQRLLKGLDLSKAIYVDVGANEPTRISNTYLMYRQGMQGVAIEPNIILCNFFRRFRPRDIVINSAVGKEPALGLFSYTSSHSSGTFQADQVLATRPNVRVIRKEFLPVLTLDIIMSAIKYEWICFMSVDTEGMDYEVLQGATKTLDKTYLLCVETNDMNLFEDSIIPLLGDTFEIIKKIGCNHILRNTSRW